MGIRKRFFLAPLLLAAACHYPRPISPFRLEGYPGAAIQPGLFPLRDGERWVFRETLGKQAGRTLDLEIDRVKGVFLLRGRHEADVSMAWSGRYLEISRKGKTLDRPLVSSGAVGQSWSWAGATATAFGYDHLRVLGRERRALVVAVTRGSSGKRVRDLYWFVRDMGWVRIRTEVEGNPVRDALCVEYHPGRAAH